MIQTFHVHMNYGRDNTALNDVTLEITGVPQDELAHLERVDGTRRLRVDRLSRRHVVQLLREAVHSPALAEQLGEAIIAKSDGNPFFVLELVRELRESGILKRLPDLVVDNLNEDNKVNLRNYGVGDKPILLWMWAPH